MSPESFSESQAQPPHYVLLSQSTLPSASPGASTSSSTLVFPRIHYHYVGDPPLALLPPSNSKDAPPYLIMDWEPPSSNAAVPNSAVYSTSDNDGSVLVRSASEDVSVLGVKTAPAPGVSDAVDHERNRNMYIVETVTASSSIGMAARAKPPITDAQEWLADPSAALARFKQRNVVLRESFEHASSASPHLESTPLNPSASSQEEVPNPPLEDANSPPQGLGVEGARMHMGGHSPASSPETMKNVPLGPH